METVPEEEAIPEEEEVEYFPVVEKKYSPIPVCKCLTSDPSSEKPPINLRKEQIYTTVTRTEAYLRERRIPELIRFMMTKTISTFQKDPTAYMVTLLDECMLFRSGLGLPPVLYERQHLEAMVKSFDPGNRGWLSPGQIRRVFSTLGLPMKSNLESNTPTALVLNELMEVQEKQLYLLLTDGTDLGGKPSSTATETSDTYTIFRTSGAFSKNND